MSGLRDALDVLIPEARASERTRHATDFTPLTPRSRTNAPMVHQMRHARSSAPGRASPINQGLGSDSKGAVALMPLPMRPTGVASPVDKDRPPVKREAEEDLG
jgi:hypothetical protein